MKAIYNNQTVAESDKTVIIEGNHYFPPESVNMNLLQPSEYGTICPWKGQAHYYHVTVGDQTVENAASYYPDPKPKAAEIKDHVAFWGEVVVTA